MYISSSHTCCVPTSRFRTGPGVVPAKVPADVENLVLVLNGREEAKVDFARMWLDYLPNFKHLKNVAVILLGKFSISYI